MLFCMSINAYYSIILIESFPPPHNITVIVLDINPLKLTFEWSPVSLNCPALHYIITFNCGICPPVTTNTTTVCNEIQIGVSNNCTFTIQTCVCDSLVGDVAQIHLTLKGKLKHLNIIMIC